MARRKESRADILAKMEGRRLETAAARAEALRLLATGAEARVVDEKQHDGTTKVVVRARRIDVFQLLLERGALPQESFDAVRDYEADLATSMGWNTPERRPDHIRASTEGAPGQNVTQAMIDASRMVRWVEVMLTTRDWKLLEALLTENDGNLGRWRETVTRITGEHRDEAHAVSVRAMAANLKDVRDRFDPNAHRRLAA